MLSWRSICQRAASPGLKSKKLIYTMKMTHAEPIQFPKFWEEAWLKIAIDELDSRKMTPDQRASL